MRVACPECGCAPCGCNIVGLLAMWTLVGMAMMMGATVALVGVLWVIVSLP
jgi:hypothetical protein